MPWELGDANLQLFHADCCMAIGVYNQTIFLLGGFYNRYQITEYRMKHTSNPLINLGDNALISQVYGHGQFWVQKNNILYILQPGSPPNQIATYNMATNEFTPNRIEIPQDVGTDAYGCIALLDSYLYVTGGGYSTGAQKAFKTVQIFNLSSFQWIPNAPSMNEERSQHACIVHNAFLWAFGGSRKNIDLKTNERINIFNITQNNWLYVDPLPIQQRGLRCVSYGNTIYIISGGYYDFDQDLDIVYIMNAETGAITQSVEQTPKLMDYSSPVVSNDILYLFGGLFGIDSESYDKIWIFYRLSPMNLTKIPTINPTNTPTITPSKTPNNTPSDMPSVMDPLYKISTTSSWHSPSTMTNDIFATISTETAEDIVIYKSRVAIVIVCIIILLISIVIFICIFVQKRMKKKKIFAKNNEELRNEVEVRQAVETNFEMAHNTTADNNMDQYENKVMVKDITQGNITADDSIVKGGEGNGVEVLNDECIVNGDDEYETPQYNISDNNNDQYDDEGRNHCTLTHGVELLNDEFIVKGDDECETS